MLIFAAMNQPGKIIIITAPSGAGKTSITHYLLQQFPTLTFSISAATRQPRGTEVSGKDYYFMSEEDFRQKIRQNEFLEWEMVYEGKYYGTLKSEMDRIWSEGKTPILDIDVKGAIHVQQQYPGRCLSLFIQAPSVDALKERLEGRGTETAESLATRLSKASYEMSFRNKFDAVIVNDVLENAQHETEGIVQQFLQ
ncbi:MAG TPA: guanylate kinase [Phnomibacter sp.]|nr:guanylate kinase [Phnomibacter sp.]